MSITDFTTLNTYAVLAGSGISTVNITTITNGNYGSSPTPTYTGTFVGTQDSDNAGVAQTELTDLVDMINAFTPSTPTSGGGGTITYTSGKYSSGSTINFTSGANIILDAQGDSNAQFLITATSSMNFDNVSSITLANNASNYNVFWLAGTAITFTGTSPPNIPGIFIAGTQITFANASQISGRVYAQTENVSFSGISRVNGEEVIVCYLKGTLILTTQGYIPIENIKAGDMVVTKGQIYNFESINEDAELTTEPILWIGNFKVNNLNSKSRPICIKKDALGENYPFQDLYVSPCHSLLLNGKPVSAKYIVNETTIYQDNECNSIEYYHLECKNHSAIFANGVLAESYLDVNNRYVFENTLSLNQIEFASIPLPQNGQFVCS
jgi:hypothetical protein